MQPSEYPEPGKIHKLPIQVYYNIPSSEHTCVTALEAPRPVFVHPAIFNGEESRSRSRRSESIASHRNNRGDSTISRKRRKLDRNGSSYTETARGSDSAGEAEEGVDDNDDDGDSDDDEQDKWLMLGSTNLKAVLEAVCKASPELFPSATTSDSSVYIPVDQPNSSSSRSAQTVRESSSRAASMAPGLAMVVPKTEPEDPALHLAGYPQYAAPAPYPYGQATMYPPAVGQYLHPSAQPGPAPQSAPRRKISAGNAHQADTPSAAPPQSPMPQDSVTHSAPTSQMPTPTSNDMQTPGRALAKTSNGARDSVSGMPPPMGQRPSMPMAPSAAAPHYPPQSAQGQPYGYPYSAPYPGYPGYPQYAGHPQHAVPGYPPGTGPVPILVSVPAPHGQVPNGGLPPGGSMPAPYPYYATPNGVYAHGMPPPQSMPGYPYPTQPMYYPAPPPPPATPAPDTTGAASALGVQANQVTFQGKGLLSWILAEQGDGKSLVKGKIVRCNDWGGLLGAEGDESDQSDDENGSNHQDDQAEAEGGLEALVKAAARRNERKRKREERERSFAEHLNVDSGRAPRAGTRSQVRWGIEIRINLRTVNGPMPSRISSGSLQPSPNLKPAQVTGSQRSTTSAGNSARPNHSNAATLGRPAENGPASRAGSAVPAQQPRPSTLPPDRAHSALPTPSAGQIAQTKQPMSLTNSHLQDKRSNAHGNSARKGVTPATSRASIGSSSMPAPSSSGPNATHARPETAQSIPGPIGSANPKASTQVLPSQSDDTSLAPALAVHRTLQSASKSIAKVPTSGRPPIPSIAMPSKTRISLDHALKTPPERPTAIFGSTNKTPGAKHAHPPPTAPAESTDPLRTPRQTANRKLLPSPKSSPATGLALAKSILRYPASQHTLELAQKLVGKEVFDSIVSEMGLQPTDAVRQSPSKNKLSRLSESTNAPQPPAKEAQTVNARARANDPMRNPLLDPVDQAKATSTRLNADVPSKQPAKQRGPIPAAKDGAAVAPPVAATNHGKPRTLSCDHCKTTQTRVWRVKQLPGGKERRVCDACGLYFNNTKKMRPKELWGTQQIELPSVATTTTTTKKQAAGASISKGKETETTNGTGNHAMTKEPISSIPQAGHDIHASPQRKSRISTGNAPDSVNWTPRRSSRLNPNVDSSPTGRAAQLHHRPVLDDVCDAAMSPRRSTRLTPRKVSKGKNKEVDTAIPAGKAQKRLMELTKEPAAQSPRRSLTSALTAVASGSTHRSGTAATENSAWDDNDFSFLLSDNIDELQDSGHFATDPMVPDFEMEQFLNPNTTTGAQESEDDFDPNALLIAGEDHEPKFTQKEMELLVMLSASGIASEELGMDVDDGEHQSSEATNAVPGPSRQGNPLLDGNGWTDESSPWEISTPGGEQWKMP